MKIKFKNSIKYMMKYPFFNYYRDYLLKYNYKDIVTAIYRIEHYDSSFACWLSDYFNKPFWSTRLIMNDMIDIETYFLENIINLLKNQLYEKILKRSSRKRKSRK